MRKLKRQGSFPVFLGEREDFLCFLMLLGLIPPWWVQGSQSSPGSCVYKGVLTSMGWETHELRESWEDIIFVSFMLSKKGYCSSFAQSKGIKSDLSYICECLTRKGFPYPRLLAFAFLTSPQGRWEMFWCAISCERSKVPLTPFTSKCLQQVINVELNREEIVCIVTFLYISQHMFAYFKD